MTFFFTKTFIILIKVFIHLFHELKPGFQEIRRILIELNIQMIELPNFSYVFLADFRSCQTPMGLVQLMKGLQEMEMKSTFEQVLRHLLVLAQPKKGHPPQVLLGACQHKHVSVALGHGRHVVAANKGQICQHPSLSVDGQVGMAVHELIEWDVPPVLANEALWKFFNCGRTARAQVPRGLPRGAALHMPELAQESCDWFAEECNIKISENS